MNDFDFTAVAEAVLEHDIPARRSPESNERLDWLPDPVILDVLETVGVRPIEFTVEGLLMRGRAHLLTGLGGASKTTFLSQLAVGIASGHPVLGWPVQEAGDVVLLLAEDTKEDAQRLIHDVLKTQPLSESEKSEACKRLHIFAAAGSDCTIVGPGPYDSHSRLEDLIAFCNSLPNIRLIGLDPAIALSKGRELDELDQRALANAVEKLAIQTGASVVLVSHAAKSVQYQNEIGSHYSRGSGALTDALRLEMLLRVMTTKEARSFGIQEDDRQNYVRFQVTKANRLPPSAMKARWFMRAEAGVLTPAALEVSLDSGVRITEKEFSALQIFLETDETSGDLEPCALKFADWKSVCVSKKLLTGSTAPAQDMSARRLLQSLQQKSWVSQNSSGFWSLTEQGFEALLQK